MKNFEHVQKIDRITGELVWAGGRVGATKWDCWFNFWATLTSSEPAGSGDPVKLAITRLLALNVTDRRFFWLSSKFLLLFAKKLSLGACETGLWESSKEFRNWSICRARLEHDCMEDAVCVAHSKSKWDPVFFFFFFLHPNEDPCGKVNKVYLIRFVQVIRPHWLNMLQTQRPVYLWPCRRSRREACAPFTHMQPLTQRHHLWSFSSGPISSHLQLRVITPAASAIQDFLSTETAEFKVKIDSFLLTAGAPGKSCVRDRTKDLQLFQVRNETLHGGRGWFKILKYVFHLLLA